MPNIRQMRKRVTTRRKWTKEAMEQAILEVQAGRSTTRHAAKQFGIPKSSLRDRLCGRVAADVVKGQHQQLLTPEDENSLVEYCLYAASHGCPQRKFQVVAKALAIYNFRNPDKPRTVLGQTWWINFRERHHHRLVSQSPNIIENGKKPSTERGLVEVTPFSLLPKTPPSSPSSNPYLTHPLVASGLVSVDLARILSKACNIEKVRRSTPVLTAKEMSDIINEVKDRAAGMEARSVQQQQEVEDSSSTVSSSTLPGGSRLNHKIRLPPASQRPSLTPCSSTTSHLSMSSKNQCPQIVKGKVSLNSLIQKAFIF